MTIHSNILLHSLLSGNGPPVLTVIITVIYPKLLNVRKNINMQLLKNF